MRGERFGTGVGGCGRGRRSQRLTYEAQLCVSGCGQQESETYVFLSCQFFGQLWQLVRNWLGVYSTDPSNIVDHFYQFGTSFGYGKCSLMHLIWFACSWVLWKERNDKLFQNKVNSPTQILENVKLLSFWWFKAKYVNFYYRSNTSPGPLSFMFVSDRSFKFLRF